MKKLVTKFFGMKSKITDGQFWTFCVAAILIFLYGVVLSNYVLDNGPGVSVGIGAVMELTFLGVIFLMRGSSI